MNFGLLPNPIDKRDLWLDELPVAGSVEVPSQFIIPNLRFENQGGWPFCAAFSGTKLIETKSEFEDEYSQADLFFKSGGSKKGTYFRAILEAARVKGLVDYEELPMPSDLYDLAEWEDLKLRSDQLVGKWKIPGYARVANNSDEIKSAMLQYGALLVGVDATRGYFEYRAKRNQVRDNHAVLLVGWDEGSWIVFDSLERELGFNGYHHLDASYEFYNAWCILDLPPDWRKKKEETQQNEFQYCLDHYGKPRNLSKEKEVANELEREFKKFNNQSVWEAAGKFWTVYVNAISYDSYNSHYYKPWPIWKPGDVINDCFNWRRTGKHLFDFNFERTNPESLINR